MGQIFFPWHKNEIIVRKNPKQQYGTVFRPNSYKYYIKIKQSISLDPTSINKIQCTQPGWPLELNRPIAGVPLFVHQKNKRQFTFKIVQCRAFAGGFCSLI